MLVTFGRAATTELRERVRERLVGRRARRSPTRPRPAPAADDACSRCSPTRPTTRSPLRRARLVAGARRLRRRHHRDHPPVLPADARRARRGGGRRPGRRVRRVGRRPARRGRRRPLRAQVRRPGGRAAAVRPRRAALELGPAPPSTTGRPGWSRPTREPGQSRPTPLPVRRGRARPRSSGASGERRVYTYDDMLTRLDDALADPRARRGRSGCGTRYRVVLVDEFQDTDPVQWDDPAARLPRRTPRWC